jgi:hypothetical protein
LLAPCGIDCLQCDAYIATQTDNSELRQKLADDYLKNFNITIPLEALNCDACNQDGRHIGFCDKCAIRSCARGKGITTCAECEEFPCANGSFIWVEGSKSKAKLEELKNQHSL